MEIRNFGVTSNTPIISILVTWVSHSKAFQNTESKKLKGIPEFLVEN
jgi:hypothetical protein